MYIFCNLFNVFEDVRLSINKLLLVCLVVCYVTYVWKKSKHGFFSSFFFFQDLQRKTPILLQAIAGEPFKQINFAFFKIPRKNKNTWMKYEKNVPEQSPHIAMIVCIYGTPLTANRDRSASFLITRLLFFIWLESLNDRGR